MAPDLEKISEKTRWRNNVFFGRLEKWISVEKTCSRGTSSAFSLVDCHLSNWDESISIMVPKLSKMSWYPFWVRNSTAHRYQWPYGLGRCRPIDQKCRRLRRHVEPWQSHRKDEKCPGPDWRDSSGEDKIAARVPPWQNEWINRAPSKTVWNAHRATTIMTLIYVHDLRPRSTATIIELGIDVHDLYVHGLQSTSTV